ncbi:extracellular protein SEL-1-like protein [Mitosporidium daphniae]|uniref:Extracellular protein SEL-1-like protein n=1 Tax=Mitosporidium daphniae TaxID=1485682 RepID=A0A098VRV0_9MICR|nr:extracellular protein SEL-1-like protein [Mitosporidium daphniae]KGG51778.1 extracellular protein SEL-1-like protein [Mitosporidium daphniae]|eukprot:XP_013238205.1 extracellular protein SEL-1-like protein [Mitosporidium daphniae]
MVPQTPGTTVPLSFDEALKAIREKMATARKKKGGIDPHAQLAIVKGIIHLAAMAAECTGALVAMPIDDDEDHDQNSDVQEPCGAQVDTQPNVRNSAINFGNSEGEGRPVSTPPGSDLLRIDLTASAEVLRAEGMHMLKRLASSGNGRHPLPEAQCFLAQLLRGHGDQRLCIKTNMDRAFSLSLQASKHGLSEAIFWTALSYERGMGVRKDAARAVTFYRKAATLGHGRAMHRLAIILQHGQLGMAQAPKEAFTWLKRAASIGSIPGAIHDLALMFEHGNGNSIAIPDDSYALELFKKASAMRYAPSMVKLGTCFEYGRLGCPLDPRKSIEWYRKAAELGDPAAELALSGWYLTGAKEASGSDVEGDGVILPQSDKDAYAWAKRAAERRDPRAEYALGRYCELGVGLDAPALQEALHWYSRAALQGHRKAKRRRAELKKSIRFSSSETFSTSSSSIRFVKSLLSGGRWGS